MQRLKGGKVRFAIDLAIRPREFLVLLGSVAIIMLMTEMMIQRALVFGLVQSSVAWAREQMQAGVLVAGFLAQLVDGALGMGYGVTSSTVLLCTSSMSPTTASASVHLAQLGTTLASGIAHHRYGNVDWPTVAFLGASGVLGAFLGSLLLPSIPPNGAKSVTSSLLFGLGAYIFVRFYRGSVQTARTGAALDLRLLIPLGFTGGFIDATCGGGWGPVATSALVADARLEPSKAIGTVSASEFLVTVSAVAGFCISLGAAHDGVQLGLVATLLLGGVLAAPIAPLFVTRLHPRLLGVVCGGFICVTNVRGILKAYGASSQSELLIYPTLLFAWLSGCLAVFRNERQKEASTSTFDSQ